MPKLLHRARARPMPRHASTCLCEGCERDGTGDFADREAAALARVVGCDDGALQARLFLALSVHREQQARQPDCTVDAPAPGCSLVVVRVPS